MRPRTTLCLTVFLVGAAVMGGCQDQVKFTSARFTLLVNQQDRPLSVTVAENRRITVYDPKCLRRVAEFFSGLGTAAADGPERIWEAGVWIDFTRSDGTRFRVESDFRKWTDNGVPRDVKGDLATYVFQLFAIGKEG